AAGELGGLHGDLEHRFATIGAVHRSCTRPCKPGGAPGGARRVRARTGYRGSLPPGAPDSIAPAMAEPPPTRPRRRRPAPADRMPERVLAIAGVAGLLLVLVVSVVLIAAAAGG